jgi:hypothetical protein
METDYQTRARARIAIISSHIEPLHTRLCREKNRVAMLGALGFGAGVLAVGLSLATDGVAVVAAAPAILFSSGAASRHVVHVVPRDREIGGFVEEARGVADEAGIEFETNYIPPRERLLGRTLIRLGLRK